MQQNSEVARLMSQIQAEREAAERGLYGLASGTAKHAFIEARAERGADAILLLVHAGRYAEALALMSTPDWGVEDNLNSGTAPASSLSPQKRRIDKC